MDWTPSATNNKCSLCLYFVKLMMKLVPRLLLSTISARKGECPKNIPICFSFSHTNVLFFLFSVFIHIGLIYLSIENVACSQAARQMRKIYTPKMFLMFQQISISLQIFNVLKFSFLILQMVVLFTFTMRGRWR